MDAIVKSVDTLEQNPGSYFQQLYDGEWADNSSLKNDTLLWNYGSHRKDIEDLIAPDHSWVILFSGKCPSGNDGGDIGNTTLLLLRKERRRAHALETYHDHAHCLAKEHDLTHHDREGPRLRLFSWASTP